MTSLQKRAGEPCTVPEETLRLGMRELSSASKWLMASDLKTAPLPSKGPPLSPGLGTILEDHRFPETKFLTPQQNGGFPCKNNKSLSTFPTESLRFVSTR